MLQLINPQETSSCIDSIANPDTVAQFRKIAALKDKKPQLSSPLPAALLCVPSKLILIYSKYEKLLMSQIIMKYHHYTLNNTQHTYRKMTVYT
jgi:hypothetical protein